MTTLTIHPFEQAGLGCAPFAFRGITVNVIKHPDGSCQPGGCCGYCSNGIKYECQIESHDGKHFVVGTDCVKKIGRSDNRLLSDVEKGIAKLNREKKDAERTAKRQAECERRDAVLQVQRERNGGLTDAEVQMKERLEAESEKVIRFSVENKWLLDVLNGMNGDFISSMVEKLKANSVKDLSDRCVSILCDIYAKSVGGRSGSKKYYAACDEFGTLAGLE